ncbi:MAG: hypothetical protein EBV07_01380 [Proteobacteria bacterium]|nr:hypothetical protein [Pseudomonadota bacterium]
MDQEVVDNKITKDLAQTGTLPAVELPCINIVTKLSQEDLDYIENEIIPFAILKNIKDNFVEFSEEWVEIYNGIPKTELSKSNKISFRFFHLHSQNIYYKNRLISNTYQTSDNYQIIAIEARKEVLKTDGDVLKNEKKEIKSSDGFFRESFQEIEIFNLSYLIILDREKKTNPYGRWEHFDEILIYMTDRMKLDYLRMYIGSKF